MLFPVKEAMTTDVVTVQPDTTAEEACSTLIVRNISGLPVVDNRGRLVGIVSERDFLGLLTDHTGPDGVPCRVSDLMNRRVITIDENDCLTEVAEVFKRHDVRRLPVLRNDKLAGIVSRRDVIRFIRRLRAQVRGRECAARLHFRTQQDIAEYCGVSRAIVQRQMRLGKLDATKHKGVYELSESDLATLSPVN